MLHDTIFGIIRRYIDMGMLMHHLFSMVTAIMVLYNTYGGIYYCLFCFWVGITDPLHSAKLFMDHYKVPTSALSYRVVQAVNWVLYMSRAFFWIPFIIWSLCSSAKIPFYQSAMITPISYLSIVWALKLTSNLWKTIPLYFSNPCEIEKSDWWRSVKNGFTKYTRTKPYNTILTIFLVFATMVTLVCLGQIMKI